MSRILRFANTVRYLKREQILGRLRRTLFPARFRPTTGPISARANLAWHVERLKPSSMLGPGEFRFLNEAGAIDGQSGWAPAGLSRLWHYNLHYFDDLNAQAAQQRVQWHADLIDRWIRDNPAPAGTGWEPYPTSLRIVNWVKWFLSGNDTKLSWLKSLADQAGWLAGDIEYHLLGNHLFSNAKALVFAGVFLEGEHADRWLETGLGIVARQLDEQILGDGGQFERSPMYHALAVEDILDLVNLAGACQARIAPAYRASWSAVAGRMLGWLQKMTHADGEIALFNDSAFGIAASPASLEHYAGQLGIRADRRQQPLEWLEASGYVSARVAGAHLIADVGEIGPDYLPGHAHADTLSFELTLSGTRFIVDTGCSTYAVSAERLRQRGTAAHNTVVVDGKNSSEVWSSFRVARRARPLNVRCESRDGSVTVQASHDGYRRFATRALHHRRWKLTADSLTLIDEITGRYRSAVLHILLHPAVSVEATGSDAVLAAGGMGVRLRADGGGLRVAPATWHPEFGRSVPTLRIEVPLVGNTLCTTLRWTDPDTEASA